MRKDIREKVFRMVEPLENNITRIDEAYDVFMMATIVVSLFPLFFNEASPLFFWMDMVATIIFIIDYIIRWSVADLELKKGWKSFIIYPFTPMAIMDLLTILPTIIGINGIFRTFKVVRLVKSARVLRFLRYSRNIRIISQVFQLKKQALISVAVLALGYIVLIALIMFNVEPETFGSYFDALYWAATTVSTVGYGDIYSTTALGRIITIVSALVGIIIIALPSGIITAGYLEVMSRNRDDE